MKAVASTICGIQEKDSLQISSFTLASQCLQKDRDDLTKKSGAGISGREKWKKQGSKPEKK